MVELSSASKTRNAMGQVNDGSLGVSRQVHLVAVLNIIDRYIAKMFFGYLVGGLIVFVTMFLTVDAISSASRFDVSSSILIQYYMFKVPGIVQQMIPVACLLGTIFTLSTLSKSNELVALFSAGMSLARISSPILILVVMISVFSFWLGDRIIPIVSQKEKYIYYVELKKQPGLYSTVKTDKIWYRSNNILFNIRTLQAEQNKAAGLTMYYFNGAWELIQLVTAKSVDLKGERWELQNGSVTLFDQELNVPMTQTFDHKTITMGEDAADLQSTSKSASVLSLSELGQFIQRNKEAGLDTRWYEVEYHSKFSFAFAAFVMSFIGIPFSVGRQRSGGTALNAGICIGLAFVYYAFYNSGIILGQHGYLPPILAAWVPNLIILGLSGFLILRLKK